MKRKLIEIESLKYRLIKSRTMSTLMLPLMLTKLLYYPQSPSHNQRQKKSDKNIDDKTIKTRMCLYFIKFIMCSL